jgi:hypothetical protein
VPWFYSRARFRDLEDRLEKAERELRTLGLDAADLYEKARTILGRTSKRAALAAKSEEEPLDEVPAHLRHMDPVSRKIHMQRLARLKGTG